MFSDTGILTTFVRQHQVVFIHQVDVQSEPFCADVVSPGHVSDEMWGVAGVPEEHNTQVLP